jgi:hypothetical protein
MLVVIFDAEWGREGISIRAENPLCSRVSSTNLMGGHIR